MSGQFLARGPRGWLLLACIILIALNMRGPFVGVAPVAGAMQGDLGLSPIELGLLTSIPVLCFALFSPVASLAARSFGAEFAITLTLLGVLAGICIRSAGGTALAMAGTVVIGLAITVGNIALPVIIRRDFPPRRQGTAMGVYTAALNVGAFLTSVATAPLAELAGWRVSLLSTGILALAGVVFWALAAGPREAFLPTAPVQADTPRHAGVRPSGWLTAGLTAGFAGQAFSYYAVTAWLPSYLGHELGMSASAAGAGSSLFQILAIVGGLGVPLVAKRMSTTAVAVTLGVLWLTVPLGLLLMPELWWLWSVCGGIAQGGGITVIFIAIIQLAKDLAAAGRMSAVVQGVGYSVASVAPTAIGFVYDASGTWTVPLLVITGSVLAFFLGTVLSVRRVPHSA